MALARQASASVSGSFSCLACSSAVFAAPVAAEAPSVRSRLARAASSAPAPLASPLLPVAASAATAAAAASARRAGWGLAAHQQVRSLNKACGLVGYPNVGKSTLFNALVGGTVAAAENFPFCTVEPNVVKVPVPDPRVEALAKACGSQKAVPGAVEIRDIAGLIKGASAGAGMGNAFLSQIRGVQVILHVVRCFSNESIVHVDDPVNIDPVKEYESILEELTIADLELAAKRLPMLRKKATTTPEVEKALPTYEAVLTALEGGRPARSALAALDISGAGDEFLSQLITAKPVVVLANVSPEDAAKGNAFAGRLAAHVAASEAEAKAAAVGATASKAKGGAAPAAASSSSLSAAPGAGRRCVVVSAPLEAEVAQLDDEDFRAEYLASYGLGETDGRALPRILAECQQLLGLVSYITVGEQEARSWFIPKGARAAEAAGAIHSDFVKNFEQADVWGVEDILRLGGKGPCRKAGLVKQKGKDYEVQDGDVLEFRIRGGRS